MTRIFSLLVTLITVMTVSADTFSYQFKSSPLPVAIQQVMKDHPQLDINFIYNELENYKTSATVNADNAYDALRQLVGLNPVTVAQVKDTYYIEALQHGRYVYSGNVIGEDKDPVVAATIMLLAPKDSTVLTYGITDDAGKFSIPCDRQGVIAKLSCVGYKTTFKNFTTFNVGTIMLTELPVQLGAVTIEGETASLLPDRSIYRPTQRQKNASHNAIDLLRLMAIPQIQINPISDAVTDNAGITVDIFINNLPASSNELQGLRTLDVKRIEYIENPTDPRFRGAQRAINIIVHEYQYGGYTKISAQENILTGLSSNANIFSKFSYKKMIYDFFVASNNLNNHHGGYDIRSEYSLKDAAGSDRVIKRNEIVDKSHTVQNQYPVSFRATYSADKVQIRNTVGFSHYSNPVQNQSGKLTYYPGIADSYTYDRSNSAHTNSISYQGNVFVALPNDFSINATPQFTFSHFNNDLTYTTSTTEPIERDARENAYFYRIDATLQKSIGKKHTLMLQLNGGDHINRLKYTGNNVYSDRFHNAFAAGRLSYQLRVGKVNIYTDAGVIWEESEINGIRNDDTYPFVHLNFRYSPNTKNSVSAYFQFANNTPGVDAKASDLLKDNEFMYITGNPLLGNARHVTCNLSYTWTPSNTFWLSAFGNYFEIFNKQITVYEHYGNDQALLRSYVNDGNYIQSEVGLSANLKLFDRKLNLYISPRQGINRSTGIFDKNVYPFQFTAQAVYYLKQFYFMAYYQSPRKKMSSDSPVISHSRNYYTLTAGWSKSDLNISLTGCNLFSSSWESSDMYVSSPLFKEHRTYFGTNYHARINLSVTYTFGYGKKVQRGNEVGEQSAASSAILK